MVAQFFFFREGVLRKKRTPRCTTKGRFSYGFMGEFAPTPSLHFKERFDAI